MGEMEELWAKGGYGEIIGERRQRRNHEATEATEESWRIMGKWSIYGGNGGVMA